MFYTREAKISIFLFAAVALFLYGAVQLGAWTLHSNNYVSHRLYFKDVSGLCKKSEVRIAGVKVGYVQDITLVRQDNVNACVHILVEPGYQLYADACGVVRKEGLLGPIYLEITPGSSHQEIDEDVPCLQTCVDDSSIDELVRTVRALANDLQEVTNSVKVMCQTGGLADRTNMLVDNAQEVAQLFKQGVQQVNTISATINEGNGSFGKLLQDEKVYQNIRYTTDIIAQSFKRFKDLFFVFDGHVEHMFERAEHTCFKDTKAFFNMRIYPRPDYFYRIGVTTSQKGYVKRVATYPEFTDNCLRPVCSDSAALPEWAYYQYLFNKNQEIIKRNALKLNLQIGKFYKNISLRAGLIEGTAGVGADLFIPFNGHYGIISTFELYDLRGQNRIDDTRPHLKWFNRLFLFDHVYLAIGVDDFASKCNKSFFLGAGFRFGEADFKWFLPNYVGT